MTAAPSKSFRLIRANGDLCSFLPSLQVSQLRGRPLDASLGSAQNKNSLSR